jgi:retinol dehydrogenase 12
VAYHFASLPTPHTDCTGKVAIVTGATGGLGLEAARHFARLNAAKIILGCRSTERGEVAKRSIEETVRVAGLSTKIEVWPLDLGSFESVRDFCRRASDDLDRLDYVMENAGLAVARYRSLEGYEETITVNVLSTFLMALLLLPVMRRTATQHNGVPHMTFVSSDAHYYTSFPQRLEPSIFESLKGDKDMINRYYISKLLDILLARK